MYQGVDISPLTPTHPRNFQTTKNFVSVVHGRETVDRWGKNPATNK